MAGVIPLDQVVTVSPRFNRSVALVRDFDRPEALERFVRREPLRRAHECCFGVLALESEPVDLRLCVGRMPNK